MLPTLLRACSAKLKRVTFQSLAVGGRLPLYECSHPISHRVFSTLIGLSCGVSWLATYAIAEPGVTPYGEVVAACLVTVMGYAYLRVVRRTVTRIALMPCGATLEVTTLARGGFSTACQQLPITDFKTKRFVIARHGQVQHELFHEALEGRPIKMTN
jgi:hypothetical protein